ncbi:MAG: HEPN domain-containing protein [Chloroflexi bacterium]|nr:HEPN domain-containing protein [Chloroflexota bacterium]
MHPDPASEAQRWLAQAERDLDDARFNASGGRHHLACFLSQQSAEKALKAVAYLSGEERMLSHSCAELVRAQADGRPTLAELFGSAAALDKYYIPTRYPNGLPGGIPSDAFSAEDSAIALGHASRIVQACGGEIER